jgi:hypothetical protein
VPRFNFAATMTGQPGYPGYTAANKQQAPPQYAALANQEQEPSPPMYAIVSVWFVSIVVFCARAAPPHPVRVPSQRRG